MQKYNISDTTEINFSSISLLFLVPQLIEHVLTLYQIKIVLLLFLNVKFLASVSGNRHCKLELCCAQTLPYLVCMEGSS